MKRFILAAALALIMAGGSANAQDATCSSKAVGKDGRLLVGAAKTSFMNKCCKESAVSKDGKPLSGAAKTSFVKKCTGG